MQLIYLAEVYCVSVKFFNIYWTKMQAYVDNVQDC